MPSVPVLRGRAKKTICVKRSNLALIERQSRYLGNMDSQKISAPRIVLASASPRRKTLLEWAETPFVVIPSHVDESFPDSLKPEEAAVHIARRKANAVREGVEYLRHHKGLPIVAADTMVVLDDEVIGKPANRADAVGILSKLAGRVHHVVTGVVIMDERRETRFHDVTKVEFHDLSSVEISHYVDRYKPYDKAGAYAIQEWIGVVGIRRIEGDFYNVMGLPVSRVLSALSMEFS